MLLCDSHNHILHNMASGAATLDESLTMSRALYAQGTKFAIVCPAFDHRIESVNRFILRRNHALEELRSSFKPKEKRIKLIPSCEITLDPDMVELDQLDKLLIPGTPFLPISLPLPYFGDDEVRLLSFLIQKRAIFPYFLHIERYISFFDSSSLDRLMSMKKAVYCLSVRAFGEQTIVKALQKYIFQGARILPMTNAHNLCSMPPELRPEMLHIDGHYANHLYHNIIKTSNTFFSPFIQIWRRSRLG